MIRLGGSRPRTFEASCVLAWVQHTVARFFVHRVAPGEVALLVALLHFAATLRLYAFTHKHTLQQL